MVRVFLSELRGAVHVNRGNLFGYIERDHAALFALAPRFS